MSLHVKVSLLASPFMGKLIMGKSGSQSKSTGSFSLSKVQHTLKI